MEQESQDDNDIDLGGDTLPQDYVDEGIMGNLMQPEHPIYLYINRFSTVILVDLTACFLFNYIGTEHLQALHNTFIIGFTNSHHGFPCKDKRFYFRYQTYIQLREANQVQIATVPSHPHDDHVKQAMQQAVWLFFLEIN
ncbi:hypothetical protein Btru_021666 [Bulinus truncatus]|nr:hypothetical protein Btru_021666 [Bulinus truncatus]